MIAYLKGKVLRKNDKSIILDTGNVGYSVASEKGFLEKIEEGSELELFIHSHIREDSFDLYGFENEEQLNFFKKLISINGIGPRVALEIISVPANKIKSAIINEDSTFICQVPGIGKKTAQRLILELKDKIEVETLERTHSKIEATIHEEALDALIKLGYHKHEVRKNLQGLPEEMTETEEIITFFLKNN